MLSPGASRTTDSHLCDQQGRAMEQEADEAADDRPVDANELQIRPDLPLDRVDHVRDGPVADSGRDEFADPVSMPRRQINHHIFELPLEQGDEFLIRAERVTEAG